MDTNQFLANSTTKLSEHSTLYLQENIDKETAESRLKITRKELSDFQDVMYAHDKYSVLIIFQGMDTSGKDSLIREVFKNFNPRGVEVSSFKVPAEKELQHDFLWRHYKVLPEKGKFGVFNRSHYENVLVAKVRPEIVVQQNHPAIQTTEDINDTFWQERYESINDFEKHLSRNDVIILKFFLHLSKEEQKKRLLRRLDQEKHNWKFSPGDLKERKLWDAYMQAYEDLLQCTSKENAPWYIVPADNKEVCRYIVGEIILETLNKYTDIKYPQLSEEIKSNIQNYRSELLKDV